MEMIKRIIEYNAELLGIDVPEVTTLRSEDLPTKTTRCAVRPPRFPEVRSVLVINRDFLQDFQHVPNAVLYLSHEMRHLYQIKSTPNITKHHHATQDKRKYNEQSEEIDAWAWAVVMTEALCGVTPQLDALFGKDLFQTIRRTAHTLGAQYRIKPET